MLAGLVDKFTGVFADLMAPTRCHWCASPAAGPTCAGCARDLPWNLHACSRCALPLGSACAAPCGDCAREPPPQDAAWTAFTYRRPVSGLLLGLKFQERLAGAHVLAQLMASRLATRAAVLPELLVPVPLHPARLRGRGYNQAGELARELGRRLSIPVATAAARRRRATPEQTRLPATERRRNLREAFDVAGLRGRHVALVDDVITTGTTIAELARAAREAGAARIEAWAVARAE